jgi:hypothetical protein
MVEIDIYWQAGSDNLMLENKQEILKGDRDVCDGPD